MVDLNGGVQESVKEPMSALGCLKLGPKSYLPSLSLLTAGTG